MDKGKINRYTVLSWAKVGCIVITLAAAILFVAWYHSRQAESMLHLKDQVENEMLRNRKKIETYMDNLYTMLRFMSLDNEVVQMNTKSYDQIATIYKDQYHKHYLSEIYVIRADFDGTRRPIMTFEHEEEQPEIEIEHDLKKEQQEYQVLMNHVRRFTEDSAIRFLISSTVELCQEEPGLIVSVPVYSEAQLVGIIAGMVPLENISELLEEVGDKEMILMANEEGDLFTCDDMEDEKRDWFGAQFQANGVDDFFQTHKELFELGKYVVSVSDLDIPDSRRWYLAFMYDKAAYFGSNAWVDIVTGYGTAAALFMLGIAASLLCHSLQRRLLAEVALQKAHDGLEIRVQERTNDLKEANKHWEETFYSINDAITIHDKDFNIIRANKAAEQVLNSSIGDVIGHKCYSVYHGCSCPPDGCPSCSVMNTGEPCTFEIFEPNLDKFVQIKAMPRLDKDGRIVGLIHIVQDISLRKKAEEEKRKLEDQLKQMQKIEAVGTLAGGIAHDFNNILSSLIGYTDLALQDTPEDTIAHSNLQQVLIAGSRAKELIKQILTFSRGTDQGQKPIEVVPIVKEVLKMLRSSIPITIEIRQNIEAASSMVMANPTQIHQVLVNLCTNAAHAMRESGGILEVSLTDVDINSDSMTDYGLLKQGKYLKLTVKDNGCGMSKEVADRIFEPFFTTKDVDKGTGMGLSVVHGIVESHKGRITVESTEQQGSIFTVFLPKIEAVNIQENGSTEIAVGHGERILIVDDEKQIVDMMTQTLERLKYTVIAKTNSIDALETFSASPDRFDLVITDYAMPGMNGKQLTKKLMSIRPDIPIILCTGFSEDIDAAKAESMGLKGFLMKPVVREEIAEIIRNILDKKEILI